MRVFRHVMTRISKHYRTLPKMSKDVPTTFEHFKLFQWREFRVL